MNMRQRCPGCGSQFPVEQLNNVNIAGDADGGNHDAVVKLCQGCLVKYTNEIIQDRQKSPVDAKSKYGKPMAELLSQSLQDPDAEVAKGQ